METSNKKEFLGLMQANRRIIFKICNAYCKNKDDREDLAQEIIYQLWKSFGGYNDTTKYSTWMYQIALNVAISFYRKEKILRNTISLEDHLLEFEESPADSVELEQNVQLLQRFINELKDLDKALIILYLESKSYREISEIIGISETNVATKISRIKDKLKERFSESLES